MNIQDKIRVIEAIEQEGFDYCFGSYSSWTEIEDKEFHIYLNRYLAAKRELQNFLNRQDE